MGFRTSEILDTPALLPSEPQGSLTFALAGLSPAEHTTGRYTHPVVIASDDTDMDSFSISSGRRHARPRSASND
jgi:hypothetical protein